MVMNNNELDKHLIRIETKVDLLMAQVHKLDKDLAVHKAKTSWLAAVVGGVASLLVAISGVLWKQF